MHPIHKHMSSRMGARKSDEKYDAKMAYDKNLSGKARLHYLENDIADKGMSMKAPMDMKSPMDKKGKTALKAAGMIPGVGAAADAANAAASTKRAGKKSAAKAAAAMVPGVGSAVKMKAPMKKETAKQEKDDLMKDNPVVKDASGRRPAPGGRKPKPRKPSLKDIKRGGKGKIYG